jgi:hypothetical protein
MQGVSMTEWMQPLVRVLILREIGDHHEGNPVTNPNSERNGKGKGKGVHGERGREEIGVGDEIGERWVKPIPNEGKLVTGTRNCRRLNTTRVTSELQALLSNRLAVLSTRGR